MEGKQTDIPNKARSPAHQSSPPKNNTQLLTKKESEELNNEMLTSDTIEKLQSMLKRQHAIPGFQSTLYKQRLDKFEVVNDEMVQILFQGDDDVVGHWVCVSTIGCLHGTVKYFDSTNTNISTDVLGQVARIIHPDRKSVTIIHRNVQQQVGIDDCGLFAIAFAVALCNGTDPSSVKFDQSEMRNHVKECIKVGQLSMFPHEKIPTRKSRRTKKYALYCVCRMPEDGQYIACHVCLDWYHPSCVGVQSTDNSVLQRMKFVCPSCTC